LWRAPAMSAMMATTTRFYLFFALIPFEQKEPDYL
jgi:hypothetical protein